MELIVISDTKVKVMLTPDDRAAYGLCFEEGYGDKETGTAFRSILREVARRTGLYISPELLSVRVYPASDGGCELFFSGVPCDCADEPNLPLACQTSPAGYIFSDFDSAVIGAGLLQLQQYRGSSRLYCAERGGYLLVIDEQCDEYTATPDYLYLLGDYSTRIDGTALAVCLEHGTPVIDSDAVAQLNML